MKRIFLSGLGLSASAGLALVPSGAQAQGGGAAKVCEATEIVAEEDVEPNLQIACGTAGLMLGRTDTHELIQLPSLDAAVVLTTRRNMRRAWLVMKDADGSLALEEITGTIARLGGRGARRDIDGLEIGFEDLNTGRLTAMVRSQGRDGVTLDIAGLVERSRASRGNAAAARTN